MLNSTNLIRRPKEESLEALRVLVVMVNETDEPIGIGDVLKKLARGRIGRVEIRPVLPDVERLLLKQSRQCVRSERRVCEGRGTIETYLPGEERNLLNNGRLDDLLAREDGPSNSVDVLRRHVRPKVALRNAEDKREHLEQTCLNRSKPVPTFLLPA